MNTKLRASCDIALGCELLTKFESINTLRGDTDIATIAIDCICNDVAILAADNKAGINIDIATIA
ncbi:MAG: hypothetical protein AAFO02_25675 [Bacteroidota bacterium]